MRVKTYSHDSDGEVGVNRTENSSRKGSPSTMQKLYSLVAYYFSSIFFKICLLVLPRNRLGDRVFGFCLFVKSHRRFPTDQLLFNDVLHKIKTSDEILDPLRVFVSDKEFVKLFIKAVVGDQYNVPTIAVLRSVSEVDSFDFPSTCCIKPTHSSGQVIIRKNNEAIDKETIKKWFAINYYDIGREANYKTLHPKVIIEPLIFNDENINDYKFFCFNGKPKLIQVDTDRRQNHQRMIFDITWNPQNFSIAYPRSRQAIAKPNNLENMLLVVEILAKYFGFIRIDLYSDGQQCLIGEITNCHGNASEEFIPTTGEIEASRIIFNP